MVNSVKRNGVVYTPDWVVKIINDKVLPSNLENISVCDPACGDGAFLSDIVEKICKQALHSKDVDPYYNSLRTLTGFDISQSVLSECRDRLDSVANKHFPNRKIDWNLHLVDGIDQRQWSKWSESFDYVVGNPPYVRVQHLEESRRNLIKKQQWESLSGCTDLYMLFFEYGLSLLKQSGTLCYITPSSWMKSNAGSLLRRYIGSFNLDYILDFGDAQVFDGFTTYTAITKITKVSDSEPTVVDKYVNGEITNGYRLLEYRDKLVCVRNRKKTILTSTRDSVLGDIADIKVGVQTLADNVFILPVIEQRDKLTICDVNDEEIPIETDITKRIYKASVMHNGMDKLNRIIIYPYDNNCILLSENYLKVLYPLTYRWLLENKQLLIGRDKGKTRYYQWYEYGRSVGVKTAFGKKILTSGMNKQPNFQICEDVKSMFYSGYSIKPKPGIDFEKLLIELNSVGMKEYIETISKPFLHGWRSYAKSFIQDYPINSSDVAL